MAIGVRMQCSLQSAGLRESPLLIENPPQNLHLCGLLPAHSFIFHVHKYHIFWIVKACDSLRKIKQAKSNICFLPTQWRSYYSSISWLPMMLITSLLHGYLYENQIGHYSIGLIIEMNGKMDPLFLFLACHFCLHYQSIHFKIGGQASRPHSISARELLTP